MVLFLKLSQLILNPTTPLIFSNYKSSYFYLHVSDFQKLNQQIVWHKEIILKIKLNLNQTLTITNIDISYYEKI
jgi:hypothetical protein